MREDFKDSLLFLIAVMYVLTLANLVVFTTLSLFIDDNYMFQSIVCLGGIILLKFWYDKRKELIELKKELE